MDDLIIRRMTAADVDDVTAIENATFARPWSRDSFMREMEKNPAARYLVAELDGRVIGYAGAWVVLEAERGKGIGRKLTEALIRYVSNLGAAYATLEVRVSNERAQRLYKSLGFVSVGKRKRYYEDNGEDAFLMVLEHMPEVDPDFEDR